MATKRDEVEKGLKLLGYVRDFDARTGKYHVWKYSVKVRGIGPDRWIPRPHLSFYLGKAGAVRIGRSATQSTPLSELRIQQIIDESSARLDTLLDLPNLR